MRIKRSIAKALIHHAKKDKPIEACGYLAEKDGVIIAHFEMANADQSREHFSMNPSEQFDVIRKIRDLKYTLAASYHSHPTSPARPSEEDIKLAYDPNISYVIISLIDNTIQSYKIRNGNVIPEEVTLLD